MGMKIIGLLVVTAVLTAVHLAAAQKAPPVRKIAILGQPPAPPLRAPPMRNYEIIRQALRELGYVEGHNIVIELRDAESDSQLAELLTELVGLQVEVIVALGGAPRALAKMNTGTVPIVFSVSGDPNSVRHNSC
jgi:ABC-type uncharacterized transport system substrate-binding protein